MLARRFGTASVRAGHSVLFTRADALLKDLGQARADRTFDKTFRRYLAPNLLAIAPSWRPNDGRFKPPSAASCTTKAMHAVSSPIAAGPSWSSKRSESSSVTVGGVFV